jgi:phosphoserine phosphatase
VDTTTLPLCVDLDGTLIEGDASWMSVKMLFRRSPFTALALLPLFFVDRAKFKHEVSRRHVPDPSTLTFVPEVVAFAREQRAAGRRVVLATASNVAIASRVADHLGCFDEVIASDERTFRGGPGKARALVERFGDKGFVYAGNEARDIPVWAAAAAAILVRVPAPVAAVAKKRFVIEREFA